MLTILIVIVVFIIGKFLYDKYQIDQKVGKEGGMLNKYRDIIGLILKLDDKSKIERTLKDSVDISIVSIGGITFFNILQTFKNVEITWKFENEIFGKHKLKWEFPEYMDQHKMFEVMGNELGKYQNNVFESSPLTKKDAPQKTDFEIQSSFDKEIRLKQDVIARVLKESCYYFGLSGEKIQLINKYLDLVAYMLSGALVFHKFRIINKLDKKSKNYERLLSLVYYYSEDFCKNYVNTGVIDTSDESFLNSKENHLLFFVSSRFEEYVDDLFDLLVNENDCFTEKIEEDDGYYLHHIQHKFIQDTLEVKFIKSLKGISIKWNYESSFDDFFDGFDKDKSLNKILSVIKSFNKLTDEELGL